MGGALLVLALSTRVLTLSAAVTAARAHQPQLRQAHANTDAARARVGEALAPILPQLTGTLSYQRTTGNYVPRPGAIPACTNNTATTCMPSIPSYPGWSWSNYNYWSAGLTVNQYIWDFGLTTDRWRSSKVSVEALGSSERYTGLQVSLNVRTAYFNAWQQKALVKVAKDTLENQVQHLRQVQGYVNVGGQPEIALATARTNVANAKVQLITAENNYDVARATLNQAMGVEGPIDYEVQDEGLEVIPGEDEPIDTLVGEAIKGRPDLVSLEQQIRAQQLIVSSTKGGYGPALGASASLTAGGTDANSPQWNNNGNWNATLNLNWPIFQGFLTRSQVREQQANLVSLEAQRDGIRQQVRVDVDQARLSVRAAKASVAATEEALFNAREQLRLAEGRFKAGVGNIIELSDAQTALTTASSQRVQADYGLAAARAQLLRALGRLQ